MLSGNFCDLELQTNNIEWGSGEFSTVYCAIKRVVFFGTLKVLLQDNVSTNYVADCSLPFFEFMKLEFANSNDAIFKTDPASLRCNASSFKMSCSSQKK